MLGRGSSLPGQIALKICPDALKRLVLPETIIAVTGSNGKTSTVEFIVQALWMNWLNVGWNREGANQIEGVATLLLRESSLKGKVKRDALVLECDERYAAGIFAAVRPSVIVVTNLCRDQMTRNGHPEFILDCIARAIRVSSGEPDGETSGETGGETCGETGGESTGGQMSKRKQVGKWNTGANTNRHAVKLVLNADDPYVASLKSCQISDISWYGINRDAVLGTSAVGISAGGASAVGIYDDGAFCPVCKARMEYDYRISGHFGGYRCTGCGHSRPKPDVEVTLLDKDAGEITLNGDISTHLAFPGLTGAYNLAAAVTAATKATKTVNFEKDMKGIPAPLVNAIAAAQAAQAAKEAEAAANPLISIAAAAKALDKYVLKGGRTVHFTIGSRNGTLLVSKHENSMSYNQSMTVVTQRSIPCTVLVMVNSISRKYYTSETSWLWDVNFDILENDCVHNIVLAGRYVNELKARFTMSAVSAEKIGYVADPEELCQFIKDNTEGEIYAITCFADKEKLMSVISRQK